MALTLSGTNGVVGAGFTVDASGVSVTAGVGTFSSIGAGTSIAAAGLHGTMPTINGSALTSLSAANLTGTVATGRLPAGSIIQYHKLHMIRLMKLQMPVLSRHRIAASITPHKLF